MRCVSYFERTLTADDLPYIPDAFHLEVEVSPKHPEVGPGAFETAGPIPRNYPKLVGNAFCLSSRPLYAIAVNRTPDPCVFFERFVVPYPYRYAHLEKFGTEPWSELPHEEAGLLKDYVNLFGAPSAEDAIAFPERLGAHQRGRSPPSCAACSPSGRAKARTGSRSGQTPPAPP